LPAILKKDDAEECEGVGLKERRDTGPAHGSLGLIPRLI
jgi:hypothetical protein